MKPILIMMLFLSPHAAFFNVRTDVADNEIIEAVFRDQTKHCYEARSPQLFFLSYKGQDLSDEFMDRFKDQESRVRKRSQMFGFKDKETGEWGILLAIGSINRLSNMKAEVRASCGAASLDAYSYVYQVVLKKGKWLVQRRKLAGVA